MEKEQVLAIVEKYRKMSHNYSFFGEDKCFEFEQYADIIEENIDIFIEDDYATEQDIVEFAKETYRIGINHYDREDYINMGLLDDPFDE